MSEIKPVYVTAFKGKSKEQQQVINEALHILSKLGVPLTGLSPRALEKMALAFLAVADVKTSREWSKASDDHKMKSRDIIQWINANFGENISPGSYDDIRRKDLKLPVMAEIIGRTKPGSARNDPERGYVLAPEYVAIVRKFGTAGWEKQAEAVTAERGTLAEKLAGNRSLDKIPVTLAAGLTLDLSPGKHNELQQAIVHEFLPRYGYGAEVLYIGDTADKFLHRADEKLKALNFFELEHGELPDVVAYSAQKNWLFMIEAVHSSGPISPARLLILEELAKGCTADLIYVTAFLDRDTFRKWVASIAWETEVWIATDPDHLIHFNGEKFLGPYKAVSHGKAQ